jgi:hypothetical protein
MDQSTALREQLAGQFQSIRQPQTVLSDSPKEGKESEKQILDGMGGMLSGNAVESLIGTLKKSKTGLSALKKLGLGDEDIAKLTDLIKSGDTKGLSKFAVDKAKNKLVQAGKDVGDKASETGDKLTKSLANFKDDPLGTIKSGVADIKGATSQAIDDAKSTVQGAVSDAKGAVSDAKGVVQGAVSDAKGVVQGAVADAKGVVQTTVKDGMSKVPSVIDSASADIKDAGNTLKLATQTAKASADSLRVPSGASAKAILNTKRAKAEAELAKQKTSLKPEPQPTSGLSIEPPLTLDEPSAMVNASRASANITKQVAGASNKVISPDLKGLPDIDDTPIKGGLPPTQPPPPPPPRPQAIQQQQPTPPEPPKPPTPPEPTPPEPPKPPPTQQSEPTDEEPVSEKPLADTMNPAEEDAGVGFEDALKSGFKASIAEDEDPFNIALTAVLGIGSLIGGLVTKAHHPHFVAKPPPPGASEQFSVQAGIA